MKKKLKSLSTRFLALSMIFGIMFQMLAPTMVLALSIEDANAISIGGNPTINNTTFEYANGDVTITKNGNYVTETTFAVEQGDTIVITLTADDTYNALLHDDGKNYNIMLDNNNTYTFTIGNATTNTISLTPSFSQSQGPTDPTIEAMKFDFTINGESFTNVTIGDQIQVSENFNMNEITEFYITKIAIEGVRTYTYEPHEYSLSMLDAQGRTILEIALNKRSDNYANIRVNAHVMDIQAADIAEGKTIEDYFEFYITSINFLKPDFKGVKISTNVMPDNYDFTVWNGVDLTSTSKSNPGKVTAYYGENTINLNSETNSNISRISLVDNGKVPSSAIRINAETNEITILSNYYNEIPLKVELTDGTEGYITVNRIGIFIGDLNEGNKTFYHGASAMIQDNINVDTDKYRIVAVFYHEDDKT